MRQNKVFLFLLLAAPALLHGAEIPGVPRDSNFNNTGGYDSTRVEAQLLVKVKEDTREVHFVRDNADPRVITKTYVLRHVDPYEFRDYLRQMVQSKRVGNTSLQQNYPGNTTTAPLTATVSSPELATPANAQPGYNPPLQLGSNTAVECLKYADGTGLLFVSAEDYRFEDHENGMGIDSIVAMLDNPALGAINYGSQMFFYLPKFVPAQNLLPLIQNMGMNISDVTELWQGQDVVAIDPDLNWLIFDVSNYSCDNLAKMLALYDVPIPQVRLRIRVYELYSENDERMGIDFQSWKNNEGADLFSVGGRYRNNWAAVYNGGLNRADGSERTSFYNFNPKWNTRYLDFLASRGKAKVLHTGELCVRNNTPAQLSRTTQIFYSDTSQPVNGAIEPGTTIDPSNGTPFPDAGVGPYELLSSIAAWFGRSIDRPDRESADLAIGKGEQQVTTAFAGFGFTMTVNNASVNLDETRFSVTLSNSSLIGFESNGKPRISNGNTVTQEVSLPHGKDRFVIGGLRKQEQVKSRTGIPWLMEVPYLGYLFSTESTSIRNAELIVVGECVWDSPKDSPAAARSTRSTR